MDYSSALDKLEKLREIIMKVRDEKVNASQADYDELYIRYGEAEEIIDQFVGDQKITVPPGERGALYKNYVEAGYLSGYTHYKHEGYTQLLKIIGRVRQLASGPSLPINQPSVTSLVQAIRRFRECCQYIQNKPSSEKDVQDILWIMLRANFERVEREETLPKFGLKLYRPDFGIPDIRCLVEVKFIGDKTEPKKIQEEIAADVPGYLNEATPYTGIIVLVYDKAHKLLDPRRFIEDMRSIEGILDVVVVPGIS